MKPRAQSGMPMRPFGRHGDMVSVIGFGGLLVHKRDASERARLFAMAREAGINYFDISLTYGQSAESLAPLLRPVRDRCFLSCKTLPRTRAGAEEDFKRLVQLFNPGHFDLFQLHGLNDPVKDVEAACARDGALPFLIERRAAGDIRFLGFSAHSEKAALRALREFDFDAVTFPIQFATWQKTGFGRAVVEQAAQRGMAVIAIKALVRQPWPRNPSPPDKPNYTKSWMQPITDRREAELALKYTLGLPVTTIIPSSEDHLFPMILEVMLSLGSLTQEDRADLERLIATLAPIDKAWHIQ